jgi:hypothetical protein
LGERLALYGSILEDLLNTVRALINHGAKAVGTSL